MRKIFYSRFCDILTMKTFSHTGDGETRPMTSVLPRTGVPTVHIVAR